MKLSQTLAAALALTFFTASGFSQTDANTPAPATSQPTQTAAADKTPQKWIGVRVMPLMGTTRAHLKKYLQGLPEGAGLAVTDVSAEGPAAVAGVERYDILLRADGQPLKKVETLQELLNKRNFATTVRLDVIHEGMPKTVYSLVLEKPEGEPALSGGFRGGRGRGFFGGGTSTLTYTDADGKEQKATGDQVGDFFRKMREDEKFREAVTKQGFTINVKPGPPPAPPGADAGTPPSNQLACRISFASRAFLP